MSTIRDKTIKIVIDSNLEDVAIVGAAARQLCADLRIRDSECGDIELSVAEAVNNAVIHAYRNEPGHQVEIDFSVKEGSLTIDVCDQGRKMAQNSFPVVDCEWRDRGALPESGMGLVIIKKIMDEVAYITDRGRNVLRMTRRFDSTVLDHNSGQSITRRA